MAVSTLTSKGQITIPKAVREELGLAPGQQVEFTRQSDGSYRLGRRGRRLAESQGALAYCGPTISIAQMNAAIAEAGGHAQS